MPTGYTYKIEEGCSFKEYLTACAKAFGGFFHQRDDRTDAPLRLESEDKEETARYNKKIAKAREEYALIGKLTQEELAKECQKWNAGALKSWQDRVFDYSTKMAKYQTMLAKVMAWEPPTPEHEGIKKFMIEQIQISLPYDPGKPPIPETVETYKEWMLKHASDDIRFYEKELEKHLERTKGRYEWGMALIESINKIKD